MKAGSGLLRLLLWLRRLYEVDDVEIDEIARRDMVAKLSEAIKAVAETPPLTPDDLSMLAMIRKEFGNNFCATMKRHSGIATYGLLLSDDDLPKFLQVLSITAESALHQTRARVGPRLSGATGGKMSARHKKADADARWRKRAEGLVKEIVSEGSRKWSKLALVSEIKNRWIGDDKALPSDKTITRMVEKIVQKGEISLDT